MPYRPRRSGVQQLAEQPTQRPTRCPRGAALPSASSLPLYRGDRASCGGLCGFEASADPAKWDNQRGKGGGACENTSFSRNRGGGWTVHVLGVPFLKPSETAAGLSVATFQANPQINLECRSFVFFYTSLKYPACLPVFHNIDTPASRQVAQGELVALSSQ